MEKTLELTLKRIYNCPTYCIGRLYADTCYVSDTIEDTDRGLKDTWSIEKVKSTKVYGETAIPKGRYKVVLSKSPKFGNRTWAKKYDGLIPEILDVKGFSGIRIHPANFATELLGCIAPGINSKKGQVTQSQNTYFKLMDQYLMPAWKEGREIWITIQ
ncbi:MAG: hypothetical protein IJK73_06985 [Bacteroidales bacterium]|nr:hypothetical protein [Bacteroidales bacterium]